MDHLLLTRHSNDVDRGRDPLDLRRCAYGESHLGYTGRRIPLAEVVRTTEFLWYVRRPTSFMT